MAKYRATQFGNWPLVLRLTRFVGISLTMMLPTTLPGDDEGARLFALYEASSAKKIAATYKLLYPSHRLSHDAYMTLIGDLQSIRAECNDNRLAIGTHRSQLTKESRSNHVHDQQSTGRHHPHLSRLHSHRER